MIDVVVTGASGFIGARLVKALRASGAEVLALTSKDGDVVETSTWSALPAAHTLMHLAGRTFVPDSWQDSASFMRANVLGTEQALAYCRRTGAAMVLASTYLYGIPERLPISELDPVLPNNPYALSKWLAEELASFASLHHGIPVTRLRIFNVFGEGQRQAFLIPSIIEQALRGDAIRLQDLAPRRDYVYVDDVVTAFVLAKASHQGCRTLNIGSGTSLSVREIVDTVQAIAGTHLPVISAENTRPQEIPEVIADIGAARRALNWEPQYSFEQGIQRILLAKSGGARIKW